MGKSGIQPGKRAATVDCGQFHCWDDDDNCKHCGEHRSHGHAPTCRHASDGLDDECETRPGDGTHPYRTSDGEPVVVGLRVTVDVPYRALGGWLTGEVTAIEMDEWVGVVAFTVQEDGGAESRFEIKPGLRVHAAGAPGARPAEPAEEAPPVTVMISSWDGGTERVAGTREALEEYAATRVAWRYRESTVEKMLAWLAGGAPSPHYVVAWHGETETWSVDATA